MKVCPVCLSVDHYDYKEGGSSGLGNVRHECAVCGVFGTTDDARDDYLRPERKKTNKIIRATLSYWIRSRQVSRGRDAIPVVTDEVFEEIEAGNFQLPNPAEQATNIIRYIGDATKGTGSGLDNLDPKFHSTCGSTSREFAYRLLFELVDQKLVTAIDASDSSGFDAIDVWLTLLGWNAYEAEQKGQVSGNYGFIALKFGDPVLDPFLEQHIRPAIRSIGMDLRDLRDTSRAGIIDNLMRTEIRDSAFVLVDLTHDNSGAYWEAGYAEGLGKPVLYLCEKSKFEQAKTHFDTNHCTTVMWDLENPDEFRANLVATVRRSLNK